MLYQKYWTRRQTCCTRSAMTQSTSSQRTRSAQTPEYKQPAYQGRKDARVQAASVPDAHRRKNPSGQRTRSVQDARVRQAPRSFATMQEKLLCHVGVPAPCRRRQRDGGHQCLHSGSVHDATSVQAVSVPNASGTADTNVYIRGSVQDATSVQDTSIQAAAA